MFIIAYLVVPNSKNNGDKLEILQTIKNVLFRLDNIIKKN